ncbi:MAG TPA: PqqD family protein [Paludibacteraceae bacterium]|jgi:hypothetical protein|nr:PqqD family protein [Paludibacteraceae bacterium]HPH62747.1 PqqD family protein [Paludibacteraceae bacterium]
MKAKKGFELRQIGDQRIIVAKGVENIDFGKIIAMNASSAYLWTEVDGKEFTAETLADLLVKKYDIDGNMALEDSNALAESWLKAGIIEE